MASSFVLGGLLDTYRVHNQGGSREDACYAKNNILDLEKCED